MLFFFDETADQGYVDKATAISQYGLIAGYAIPDKMEKPFYAAILKIYSDLRDKGFEKIHCSEVFRNDANEDVRERLYQIFLSFDEYLIIHEGAYSVGVKEFQESLKSTSTGLRSGVPDHIKVPSTSDRLRLYKVLLRGIIAKLEEVALIEGEPSVRMVSDHVDTEIQSEAQKTLAKMKSNKSQVIAKGFDTLKGEPIRRYYQIELKGPLTKIERVESITYEDSVTPFTFAADFVCYELLRHFRRKMKEGHPIQFQAEKTLQGFRLVQRIPFLHDYYFSDMVFRPKTEG